MTIGQVLLAAVPIVAVLVFMVGLRWGGAKAGVVGWILTVAIAVVAYGAGWDVLVYSQLKAVLQALIVLYMIWMALLFYNVVAEAGVIVAIGRGFARLTSDPVMQMIILAWAFASFIQGASGFGVPVAVASPLLVGLGVAPMAAVIGGSVGHAWAVTYGSIAMSFQGLMLASGMEGAALAPWTSTFIGVAGMLCGVATAHSYGSWLAVRHGAVPLLAVGGVMVGVMYGLSVSGLWTLASFVAGLAGVGVAALLCRLPAYHGTRTPPEQREESELSLAWAIAPYVLLIVIVLLAQLVPWLKRALNVVVLQLQIPAVVTSRGWVAPAEVVRSISFFGHPGALLAYTSLIAYAVFRRLGRYKPQAMQTIWAKTHRSAAKTTVGILTMVGFATLMSHTGMSYALAEGLSALVGPLFPLISPLIGGLGAFMTGSNTNSNFVFVPLQMATADLQNLNVLVILAAQTAGGALGSMMSPTKIIVGCSTVGLAGQEGAVMRRTLLYGVVILMALGLLAWMFA